MSTATKAPTARRRLDDSNGIIGARRLAGRLVRGGARRLVSLFHVDQLREPAVFTSVRQAAVLVPSLTVESVPFLDAPLFAVDRLTNAPVCLSPHWLYETKRVSSPNVLVLGQYNIGKSSTIKCAYVARLVATCTRVAVFERKSQQQRTTRRPADPAAAFAVGLDDDVDQVEIAGEYTGLAADTEGQVVRFSRRRGRGARVNILDPAIAAIGSDDTMIGQDELLLMAAQIACGYKLHDDSNGCPAYALRAGHTAARRAAAAENCEPLISDVIHAMYHPQTSELPGGGDTVVTLEDLARWGLPVAMNLERFTTGDLSGLIDGPTANPDGSPIDWDNPLVVFDTSDLPDGSVALELVMGVASAWISAKWSAVVGPKVLVYEEAYSADTLDVMPHLMRATAKRGRARGIVVVTALHHLSDLRPGSELWALAREAEIVHIFRQDKADDAAQAMTFFNLPAACSDVLAELDQGEQLLKIGREPVRRVQHIRTDYEVGFSNTDDAMTLTAS